MPSLKHADLVSGILFCLVAVFVYREAATMPVARRGLGPGGYPMFVAIGLGALGLILVVQSLLKSAAASKPLPFTAGKLLRVVAFVALCFGYALLLRPFGFVLASTLFLFAAINFFGYRRQVVSALFSICLSAAIYVIFRHVFLVLLPTGSIFG